MAESLFLETDVLVDFFRGHSKAVAFVNAHAARIILSSVVVAELYAEVKGDAEQAALENFVSLFRIVPVSAEIAKAGGLYKRRYGKSHGAGLAEFSFCWASDGLGRPSYFRRLKCYKNANRWNIRTYGRPFSPDFGRA